MRTVADGLAHKANNFDCLRLFAAMLVLWSHSYPLTADGKDDIFTKMLFGYDLAGSFAVAIFFTISGFLVTRSAAGRSTASYLIARSLRILPGLALAVLITVFAIGPMLTRMPMDQYFSDPSTFAYLGNMSIFDLQYRLADTTQYLPYSHTINGSLWTLSLEFGFYIILIFLVKGRLLDTRVAALPIVLTLVAFLYCVYVLHMDWRNQGAVFWRGISVFLTLKYASFFLIGGALWIYRTWIPLNGWLAGLCLLALVLAPRTVASNALYMVCVPYLTIYLAIGLPVRVSLSDRIGDLSYGIYLLAFPVQQSVIAMAGPAIGATEVSMLATPIVLVMAFLSWRFVEKPAIGLKPMKVRQGIASQSPLPDNGSVQSARQHEVATPTRL